MTGHKPSTVLAFDPSLTCTGWAFFVDGDLAQCGYIAPRKIAGVGIGERLHAIGRALPRPCLPVGRVVIEAPQIYSRRYSKGDPNLLTPLWAIAGYIAREYPRAAVDVVLPADWKKGIQKVPCFARILARLNDRELAIFNVEAFPKPRAFDRLDPPGATARAGDVCDAIGIGLWRLGRFTTRRSGAPRT